MSKITNTAKIVKEILEENPKARNSDDLLYLKTAEAVAGKDIANRSFSNVMLYRNMHGIPTYETVRRSRQKLQEKYPELRAGAVVQQFRDENEKEFRAFARGEE